MCPSPVTPGCAEDPGMLALPGWELLFSSELEKTGQGPWLGAEPLGEQAEGV